jgi:hypothetical protein
LINRVFIAQFDLVDEWMFAGKYFKEIAISDN